MVMLKWTIRLGIRPDKWKPRIKRGSAACNDIALTSLIALRDSADAFPPLKSVASGVLALWDTAERVKTSKEKAQMLSRRTLEILEGLADAVPDPSNIPPPVLVSIQRFVDLLDEIHHAMDPLTKRRRLISSVLSLNRDEATLESFNKRLEESAQSFMIGSLARMENQLLANKRDAVVDHQALIIALDTISYRIKLSVGLF
ncbi:hypothetical protein K438DRAFT_1971643 [Mycena galopus ATCC 62051]|nr:hypothetical protein K438DRAFT_1971643 [Mycena galopus ATCC 62051]